MRPQSGYSISHAWLRPASLWLASGVCFIVIGGAAAQDSGSCKLETMGGAQVVAARDARSLLLGDGREVRLAGIEIPSNRAAADQATEALAALVAGRDVTLKHESAAEDRYGRILAYVYPANAARSAQEAMLADGHAQMSIQTGGCGAMLKAQERLARDAKRGLWADDSGMPRRTNRTETLAAARGRYAVLEGTVASVRESRGVVYVNFGRRIPTDFTVTILKRNERSFAAAGLEPKSLAGKHIRVRGFLEQRRGPVIEAIRPEQIELAGLN